MMKNIFDFKNDESGAVTVDWVVLTAAIVGIAIAVISLISDGIKDAALDINSSLQTAGEFSFGGGGAMSAYKDEYGTDDTAIKAAIAADAPAGYTYVGIIDTTTDSPVYQDTSGATENLSIDGEIISVTDYVASEAEHTTY